MKKKETIMLVWLLALLLLGMALALYIHTMRANKFATERAKVELMEEAQEQASASKSTINSQFRVIETISSGIDSIDKRSISGYFSKMSLGIDKTGFSNILVSDLYGDAIMPDGTETYIGDYYYFQKAKSGERAIQIFKDHPSAAAAFALPVYSKNGEIIGVVAGLCDEQALRSFLMPDAVGDRSYCYIIDSEGIIIASVNSDQPLSFGENAFNLMEVNGEYSEITPEDIKSGVAREKGGTIDYDFKGDSRLGVFAPMVIGAATEYDWYILDTIPQTEVAAGAADESRSGVEQLLIVLLFGVVALGPFIYAAKTSRKRLEQESNALRAENQRFSIVYENSSISVWDYDIDKNEIHQDERSMKIHGFGKVIRNVPKSLIESGYVHPDSSRAFLDMYKKLHMGEKNVEGVFLVEKPDKTGYWYEQIKYSTLFDEHNRPYWAIGTSQDITERRKQEMAYAKWQKEINCTANENVTVFGWNLSKDVIDGIEKAAFEFAEECDITSGMNNLVKSYSEGYVNHEDAQELVLKLNRERLIGLYHDDISSVSMDYRRVDREGKYIWLKLTVQMVQYPDSGEIKAYIVSRDIDKEKRQELARIARAEKDSLTDALNRDAFEEHVSKLLRESEDGPCHAIIMIDIDDFKLVNDTFGHDAGDRLLEEMIRSIRALLRYNDIIGRLGGDEFMICMKDVPYDAVIEKKAQQICEVLRRKLSDEIIVSLSLGIAVFPRDGTAFEQLYKAADTALYYTKENSKDGYNFYHPNMRDTSKSVGKLSMSDTVIFEQVPRQRMLIVDDDDYDREFLNSIFRGTFAVINAKNGEAALSQIRRYGNSISIVILDLNMPNMNGFEVMANMKESSMLVELPVIAITSDASEENYLNAIAAGASDLLTKPINARLAKIKVEGVMTRIANEKLRAQNSYLRLQGAEEERYRRVLCATGTVVVIHDFNNNIYSYDSEIFKYIAGKFDTRPMDKIFLEDGVASEEDVVKLQALEKSIIEDPAINSAEYNLPLLMPSGETHIFKVQMIRMSDEYELTEKMLVTFNDINDSFEAENELKSRAERDPLTGLYNREVFFQKAGEMVYSARPNNYIMSAFDINNFRSINDQYGQAAGDYMLKQLSDSIEQSLGRIGGICCRVSADNFACIYPTDFGTENSVIERQVFDIPDLEIKATMSFSIGRYVVEDLSLPISAMYDRANMAKKSIKGRYDVHMAYYNASMRENFLREQMIIGSMEQALLDQQFVVYFQPQYNHSTGAMIGAEALTRWIHPTEGLISPGVFIPIFEKNGFVYKLDEYIWECTCRHIREWEDKGIKALPVSVNVSRFDIFQDNFYDVITSLPGKYGISQDLLRLEITETAFSSSPQQIINVVKRLVDFGFTVEIDDFGSGYSSLNTLKDVPAQVLKLDMRFMESSSETQRGGSIVNSVVRMAKWLYMPVIAEGVESIEQADFLNSIGCNYIQGYLYSKPMPANEFETLLATAPKETKMQTLETVKTLDPNMFWDPNSMETLIFNSYVGGAAVGEYSEGELEYLRINEKFIKELGINTTVDKILASDPFGYTNEEGRRVIEESIERAIETGEEVEFESMHAMGDSSAVQWIKTRVCVIGRSYGRSLLYFAIENITNSKLAERQIKETGEQLETIMDTITSGVCAYAVADYYHGYVLFANTQYYSMFGYTEDQFGKEVKNIFDVIHPEEKHRVIRHVMEAMSNGKLISYEYRGVKRDGSTVILHGDSKIISVSGEDNPVLLVVTTDVTDTIEREQASELRKYTDALVGIYDEIFEFNFQENVIKRLDSTIDSRFSVVDELEPRIFKLIDALIHPEDRNYVLDIYRSYTLGEKVGQNSELEFRLFSEGKPIWLYGRILALNDYRYILMLIDRSKEKLNELAAEQKKALLSVLTNDEEMSRLVALLDITTGHYEIIQAVKNYLILPMSGSFRESADFACQKLMVEEAERDEFRMMVDPDTMVEELRKQDGRAYRFRFTLDNENICGTGEFTANYSDEDNNKLIVSARFKRRIAYTETVKR